MRAPDTQRLGFILKMLESISKGDFNYRIPRTREDDSIEAIVIRLNMMAEEMYETLSFYSSLHVVDGKRHQLQTLFILNQNFKIRYVTASVAQQLGFEAGELTGVLFSNLLAKSQVPAWRSIGRELLLAKEYNRQHPFLLLSKTGMERSYLCGIVSVFDVETDSQFILVSLYEQVLQSKILDDSPRSSIFISHEDAVEAPGSTYVMRNKADVNTLQDIRHAIDQNLDQRLPGLKQLAHDYGINEYKLKTGFKHLFGHSVYGYQRFKRLENAQILLSSTDFTLKEVCKRCGYISMSHFIRSFKIQYGITPKAFRDRKFKKKKRF